MAPANWPRSIRALPVQRKATLTRCATWVRRLWLAGHFRPFNPARTGVGRECPFVKNQHGANDARVVRPAKVRHEIGNDIDLFVRVGERKHSLRHRVKWKLLVCALSKVLDGVSQKLELVNQVRKLRGVYLCELHLP